MKKQIRHCLICGKKFEAKTAWHKYCSRRCASKKQRNEKGYKLSDGRFCRQCGKKFIPSLEEQNRQHCSGECARLSAKASRQKFYINNPERVKEYRSRQPQLSKLDRLYKKYPELPIVCEFCGENRIVEIAHKPDYKRNGAWFRIKDTTPKTIWILCPTCHNLLDKKGYTPEQLCKK